MDVKTAVGKFVWHEIHSTDVEKAKSFYTDLFGWETEIFKPGEMDYAMIKVGDKTHGGFFEAQGGTPSHWLGHVLVEDVDETARRAEAAGGKILAGPMDIPEVGRFAGIADPQGAVFSAFGSAGEPPASEGVFVWDELLTSDVDAAKSFYTEVLGWTTGEMTIPEAPPYTLFKRGPEDSVAGCMPLPEGVQAPPYWQPYMVTDDVTATVARAKELGATILVDGMDVPEVGEIAVIQDPTGAVFGVIKPIQQ